MGLFRNIFGKGRNDSEKEPQTNAGENMGLNEENSNPAEEPEKAVEPEVSSEPKKPALSAEDHAAIRRAVAAQMRGETPQEIVEREEKVLNELGPQESEPAPSSAAEEKPDNAKLEEAKSKVRALAALKKQSEKFNGAIKELGLAIINCSTVYCMYDKDFNGTVPFITPDGRIELYSSLALAEAGLRHHLENHHGHVMIRKLGMVNGVNQTEHLLRMCMHNGLFMIRLDNGARPMDLRITDFLSYRSTGIVDDCGRGMRSMFIRQISYASRIAKLDPEVKGKEMQVGLTQAMLTMRLNGYRELGNGLLYIYSGEAVDGTIFYTANAMNRAKRIIEMSKNKAGNKALLCKGAERTEIHTGSFTPGTANVKNGKGEEVQMLCTFTDYEMAESLRKRAKSEGLNKGIVVVTYPELESIAREFGGVVIDIPSYSMQIPVSEFDNVRKCAMSKGPITVQAQKKEQKPAESPENPEKSENPVDGKDTSENI